LPSLSLPLPQAKPENLVDTFILLMPAASKTPHELGRVCELKVCACVWGASLARCSLDVPSGETHSRLALTQMQGFTKKLQGELLAQFMRKVGGSGSSMADQQQQQQQRHAGGTAPATSGASSFLQLPGGLGASSSSYTAGSPGKLPGAQQQQQQQYQQYQQPLGGAGSAGAGASPGGGGFGAGGSGSGPSSGSGGGAASNLSALKMSVNSFTRELASSMSTISRAAGGDGGAGGAGSPQARGDKVRACAVGCWSRGGTCSGTRGCAGLVVTGPPSRNLG
jgi:hypothetical protein